MYPAILYLMLDITRTHVGKLHKLWQFPSDHLPVGIEIMGIKILSWNILNQVYMHWIEQDLQGLKGSLISDLHTPAYPKANGLTHRDVVISQRIQEMMSMAHMIALQECSAPFLDYLSTCLLPNWELIKSFSYAKEDQPVLLYDRAKLHYHVEHSEINDSAYPSAMGQPLQNLYFSHQRTSFRIIHTHIPGDPTKLCREEFAQYVYKHSQQETVTIAVGDHNFEREEIIAAYQKAGFTEFILHSPWKTNIDPYTQEAKSIDHFFVAGDTKGRNLLVEEVLLHKSLQEAIDLLHPY